MTLNNANELKEKIEYNNSIFESGNLSSPTYYENERELLSQAKANLEKIEEKVSELEDDFTELEDYFNLPGDMRIIIEQLKDCQEEKKIYEEILR